jgi:hypothetical protein
MKTHGIPAQDWQLQAAANGTLQAIVLPLVPEPVLVDTKDCFVPRDMEWRWSTPKAHATWGKYNAVDDLVLKYCGFEVGDRIFLQDKWCEYDNEFLHWIEPDCEVSEHESEWLSWQPAKNMPIEAAQYLFDITGFLVSQVGDFREVDIEDIMGQPRYSTGNSSYELCRQRWNAAYPEQPWDGDRYVVVLSLEKFCNANA